MDRGKMCSMPEKGPHNLTLAFIPEKKNTASNIYPTPRLEPCSSANFALIAAKIGCIAWTWRSSFGMAMESIFLHHSNFCINLVGMTREEAYAVLGLPFGQHAAAIRSAYRKLSKQFHPDINPNGHDEFIRINAAYEILTATAGQQLTQRPAPESKYNRGPQASDFPDATDEELFWLLHPNEKSRLAYTAY